MKHTISILAAVLALTVGAQAETTPQDVVARYADLVYANYQAASESARQMRAALESFLAKPSEATMENARKVYLAARPVYGTTEAFRFYDGPIDREGGPEGLLNAWPLDESYIDAVIDDPKTFPEITEALLAGRNEKDGERNISTGYHAIEYLLWGKDTFADGPGRRSYEDYVSEKSPQAARRSTYLRVVADLLVRNLDDVTKEWVSDQPKNYRAEFTTVDSKVALQRILTGMAMLAGDELSQERMYVAYETRDQEEEHSCFSDSTLQDLEANARGVQNVYLAGLNELVAAADADLGKRLTAQLEKSIAAIRAIPPPFDQAILGADDAAGRKSILAAVTALEDLSAMIVDASTRIGAPITLKKEGDGG